MKLKSNPAPPEYIDVHLFHEAGEPPEVWVELPDGTHPNEKQMRVIRDSEEGDGWETIWRVQILL